MKIGEVTIGQLLDLEPHGPDTYVGIAPQYPWKRLFGGQVVAQALRAAMHTVEDEFEVHSLHAYFIRGGTHAEPVRFEVDRIRNGKSFRTRLVVARQSNGAILNLSCSFQSPEDEPDVQAEEAPTDVPGPEGLREDGWAMMQRRRGLYTHGRASTWLRLTHDAGPDPRLRACALTFLSDSAPTAAARAAHPVQVPRAEHPKVFIGASLDHSVWFHRPSDPTNWILGDVTCSTLIGGRGITVGRLFEGPTLVATVTQEVLLRRNRNYSPTAPIVVPGEE
jgi:acyl-CoA thioesterase II